MEPRNSHTDLGAVKIHKNVISSISASAALETEGVRAIGTNLTSRALEFLTNKTSSGAVNVEFDRNDEVKIDIPLIIKYGYNIPTVAAKAQENIRAALEKMTNLSIKDINVNIQGIERGNP